jgi:hypothetical protein
MARPTTVPEPRQDVEIIDFLRGRWLAVAIAAPVLSGAIAYVLFSAVQDDRYRSTGRVAVGSVIGDELSRDDIDVYVQTFLAYLDSTDTFRVVADEAGVTLAGAESALTAREVGADLVEVSFIADSERAAQDGLTSAVRSALADVAARDVRRAEQTAAAAEQRVDGIVEQLDAIRTEAGTTDVAGEFSALRDTILALRVQVTGNSVSDPAVAASQAELLAQFQDERDALLPLVDDYEQFSADLAQAQDALGEAQARLFVAQNLADAASGSDVMSSLRVGRQSNLANVARATVVAMIGALVAVFIAAFVLRRRNEPAVTPIGAADHVSPLGPPSVPVAAGPGAAP